MATTTFTPNLKLRISSTLTPDSKFNLRRLDSLGSIYQIDTNAVAKVRSKTNILIQPNDPDIGGTGSGGTVQIGTVDQPVSSFTVNATTVNLSGSLSLSDTAAGGDKELTLKYKSDINGLVDTSASRILNIDTEGADRNLVIGGDLSITGANLTLSLPTAIAWTLPNGNGTSGQVLTTDGLGGLDWTDSSSTTLNSLTDVSISSPTQGQSLVYNSTSGNWENSSTTAAIGVETAYTWEPADGPIKTIVHNLGSQQVVATIVDTTDSYKTVEVPDTTRPDGNTIILSATSAPVGGNWLVLLKQIIT